MSGNSKIEWTDATWNPVTGCTKVSAGCKFCYAERDFHRPYPGRAFTDVRVHSERLDQPLHWKRPRKIFVNSMSDLFHEKVTRGFLKSVMGVTVDCPQHTFQILTKRPERMREFCVSCCAFPPNVWLGVSVENQATADERIPLLLQTPAAVRFVSYEPALGPVDFSKYLSIEFSACGATHIDAKGVKALTSLVRTACNKLGIGQLDWLIAGGESGPNARPSHPDWFRSVRDQCVAAGVPFFFKQWGEHEPIGSMERVGKKRAGRLLDGREWNEFPKEILNYEC